MYLRDGLACAYCGKGVEAFNNGNRLTLDHLKPRSDGGQNETTNLITCCLSCNSRRGTKPWRLFARDIANEYGRDPTQVVRTVMILRYRQPRIAAANAAIEHRKELPTPKPPKPPKINESLEGVCVIQPVGIA